MLKPLSVVLCLLVAGPALGAEWKYEDAGVPIAYFDNGEAQFQFACRGGSFAMGFWVRKPSAEVAAATSMNLAINTGKAISAGGGTSFAQDMPLIHSDGSSMIIRGPVARQWALIARRAQDVIRVGYVRNKAQGGLEVFDGHEFGARGSNGAIARVLRQCG